MTVFLTIENALDVEGLCDKLVAQLRRQQAGQGRHDWDDARLYLREQAWIAYHDWRPERCASFLAFVSERLRLRLLDWIRRNTPEHFLYSSSLDAPPERPDVDPVRVPVGRSAGHAHDDSLADLRRAVVQRDRRGARNL